MLIKNFLIPKYILIAILYLLLHIFLSTEKKAVENKGVQCEALGETKKNNSVVIITLIKIYIMLTKLRPELLLPFAFKINRIDQDQTRILIGKVQGYQLFYFIIGLLFYPGIDRIAHKGMFRGIAKINLF